MQRIHWLLFFCLTTAVHAAPVKHGIDVLKENGFDVVAGKKIGLVTHPAGVDGGLATSVDVLRRTDRCKLTAIFGPEHGVYGDEYAGVKVGDRTDSHTGLPVYSLYGKTRKPTPTMLKGLDALVFDLQDIGSRSYTFISTMKLCLEACAEADIEFIVLDRPNPLGGERIEGPMVEKGFESFVSQLNVPYLHGMTMGELAGWVKEEVAPQYKKLRVVKMSGWKRSMVWRETGLQWIPTSPHIPEGSSCEAYAATGILGELGQVSNGVGYTQPFCLIGAPWVKADALAEAFRSGWSNPRLLYESTIEGEALDRKPSPCPAGIRFRPIHFKPFYGAWKDQVCQGVQIHLDPSTAGTLVEINFVALAALDAPKLFRQASADQVAMFDKVCGSDEPRKWLIEGRDLEELFKKWKAVCETFREGRQKFLLYE